jgi:hypothetical protein
MAKARECTNQKGEHAGWSIFCPACHCGHLFDTRWEFNGNVDLPTFTPSMLVHAHKYGTRTRPTCHSFVTNGQIAFLPDSGHAMAGQTVDLPDWEEMESKPSVPCEDCSIAPCCQDKKDNPNICGCIDGVRL